jgi:hypothetical protein
MVSCLCLTSQLSLVVLFATQHQVLLNVVGIVRLQYCDSPQQDAGLPSESRVEASEACDGRGRR